MRTDNLYQQSAWDTGYQDLDFGPVPKGDQVAGWLQHWTREIPSAGSSCLEIGCFPGRYLALFGDRGFELNGIDLTVKTEPEMRHWLESLGYRIGLLAKGDFF